MTHLWKLLSLLCICCLSLTFSGNAQNIAIGLKYASSAVTECELQNNSGFLLKLGEETISELAETKLLLQQTEEKTITLKHPESETVIYTYETQTLPLTLSPADGGTLLIDGKEYRGNAQFLSTDTGITVINFLDLEDYLKGVVASEMPYSWHPEALKAQAVCARNYAITNLKKYEKYGFNLDDTINSQVYKGVSGETPETNRAVEETAGTLLTYNGEPANTFFYSSSGGHTESSKYAWGGDYPYLVGVEDPYDTSKEWTVPYTPAEIQEKLTGISVDIGEITDLEIMENSPSGRVIDLKITGTTGEHRVKLEKTRSLFNLRSNLYTITKKGGEPAPMTVITAKGLEKRVISAPVITASGIIPTVIGTPAEYMFQGTGYGHGVGMSQYGANGMAEQGYTYEQILTHYFTGTTLERIP